MTGAENRLSKNMRVPPPAAGLATMRQVFMV
jgi:hypothetical protein